MRALVWIVEDTWDATVDEAAAFLPADAEITLLHVSGEDAAGLVAGARGGLLGRVSRPQRESLDALADEAAAALLGDARERLGRTGVTVEHRRGRVEREVIAAAASMDLLVVARDGDHSRLGPPSLGPAARFVVDHAPCRVLLVWPDEPPDASTIPPPKAKPKPKPKPPPR